MSLKPSAPQLGHTIPWVLMADKKGAGASLPLCRSKPGPFHCFKTNPKIIGVPVMVYIGFPPSMRNVKDLLHGNAIVFGHVAHQSLWDKIGPLLVASCADTDTKHFIS
jgi:hypothetical protein